MPTVHLGTAIKGANNPNYITSPSGDGQWQVNNTALQSAASALNVAADVFHRNASDYATTTTTRTRLPLNQWARFRNILTSEFGASLGNFTVTSPNAGNSTVTIDGTAWAVANPKPFVDAILQMSGNLDARAALQ